LFVKNVNRIYAKLGTLSMVVSYDAIAYTSLTL